MAKNNKGASQSKKDQEMAARMKALGIRRTSGTCPICNRAVRIPMDHHFYGAVCN